MFFFWLQAALNSTSSTLVSYEEVVRNVNRHTSVTWGGPLGDVVAGPGVGSRAGAAAAEPKNRVPVDALMFIAQYMASHRVRGGGRLGQSVGSEFLVGWGCA